MSDRTWTLADWRQRYLDHPLLSLLARRLIWTFANGDGQALGAWRDGAIVGVADRPLAGLTDTTRVRLWHPLGWPSPVVADWQAWVERHGVTQPFKQAHREIYVVTDAEVATATYSNRFAGHIIRQHQFKALCHQREWHYHAEVAWSGANSARLPLVGHGWTVEF